MIKLLNIRHAWLLLIPALTLVSVRPEAQVRGAQRPGPRPDGPPSRWTGTIRLLRQGNDTFPGDSGGSIAVRAREEATWSVRADGSAHYDVTYDEVDVVTTVDGESYSCRYSGAGAGESGAGVELVEVGAATLLGAMTGGGGTWAIGAGSAYYKGTTVCDFGAAGIMTQPWGNGIGDDEVSAMARDPRTATHLAGSQKGTTGLRQTPHAKGLGMALPLDQTISWDLSRGAVNPTPTVTIYGPRCHCFSDEDDEGASLRFVAATAVPGGEFSTFDVTADGEMPEVDANEGGDHATLELTAKPTTGAVTLKVHYTKDGKRYDAAPFTVDFCAIHQIHLADDTLELAFDLKDRLTVKANAIASFDGHAADDLLEWDIERMGTPTTLTADPSPAKGDHVTFVYQDLPERNSDFGPKKVTARVRRGSCDCQRQETIRAFFSPTDFGHPGNDLTPNWYYYWQQTKAMDPAARPLMKYVKQISAVNSASDDVVARWDLEREELLVSARLAEPEACQAAVDDTPDHRSTGRDAAEGIDCFAETLRHELQHRTDAIEWWGSPRGPFGRFESGVLSTDVDGDNVPAGVELGLGCSPISKYSCAPFKNATDTEIRAYYVGWQWPLGRANAEDWSCGPASKQWHGTKCD